MSPQKLNWMGLTNNIRMLVLIYDLRLSSLNSHSSLTPESLEISDKLLD